MAPNFEITLFLAQATGSFVLTDARARWMEFLSLHHPLLTKSGEHLAEFKATLEGLEIPYLLESERFFDVGHDERAQTFQGLVQDVLTYLTEVPKRGVRPTYEKALTERLKKAHSGIQRLFRKEAGVIPGRLRAMIPADGFCHPNVNRLLLTSGIDHYLPTVPMAFLMERNDPTVYRSAEGVDL
jgi:hypothetical protein